MQNRSAMLGIRVVSRSQEGKRSAELGAAAQKPCNSTAPRIHTPVQTVGKQADGSRARSWTDGEG